jgi:hypothetical protein
MKNSPHQFIVITVTLLLFLIVVSTAPAQTTRLLIIESTVAAQTPSEGIQKRDNEWGIWGGISFDSPTLIVSAAERTVR